MRAQRVRGSGISQHKLQRRSRADTLFLAVNLAWCKSQDCCCCCFCCFLPGIWRRLSTGWRRTSWTTRSCEWSERKYSRPSRENAVSFTGKRQRCLEQSGTCGGTNIYCINDVTMTTFRSLVGEVGPFLVFFNQEISCFLLFSCSDYSRGTLFFFRAGFLKYSRRLE